MLSKILNLMQTGKTYSIQQMSDILHTSPEIIKSGIEHLEHLGYIKKINEGAICSKSCIGCNGCDIKRFSQLSIMWERVR